MRCVFTPGLFSGNIKTDEQHKKMFEMADHMIKAIEVGIDKKELLRSADEFADYVMSHTTDEEAFMSSEGYPKLYEHKKMHEVIQERARLIAIDFNDIDDNEELDFKVLEFVVDYVIDHIRHYDLEMIEYFNVRNKMDSML